MQQFAQTMLRTKQESSVGQLHGDGADALLGTLLHRLIIRFLICFQLPLSSQLNDVMSDVNNLNLDLLSAELRRTVSVCGYGFPVFPSRSGGKTGR